MTEDRGYVRRRRNSRVEDEYIPVYVFTTAEYRCGLRAGEVAVAPGARVRVVRLAGCGPVLTGSPQDPRKPSR